MPARTLKDLPIYGDSASGTQAIWISLPAASETSELEKAVSTARKSACAFVKQYEEQRRAAISLYETKKKNAADNLEYIRSETNILPKVAFISLSGLSGLLIGFRRSAARKFVYASALTTAAASICYPKEAQKVACNTWQLVADQWKTFGSAPGASSKPIPAAAGNSSSSDPIVLAKQQQDKDKVIRVIKMVNSSSPVAPPTTKYTGDHGQSSEQDKDMYTTRSK